MKPNWKDYLRATGDFIVLLTISIITMVIILLGVFILATYQAIALGLGLIVLIGFAVLYVWSLIDFIAFDYALDRLDKDDEM